MDPARPYTPDSPYHGANPNDPDRVGHARLHQHVARAGVRLSQLRQRGHAHLYAVLSQRQALLRPEDLWPEGYSSAWKHGDIYPWPDTWTKYTSSTGWKKTGPVEHYYDPQNAAENVYRLGMAEAEYYRDTIERQRRGRPAEEQSERRACGGYIVWKYNESWPQIYSAKLDYWGEPYLPFYAIKRAYEPLLLWIDLGTHVWLWAVNDTTKTVEGTATVRLVDPITGATPRQASCPVRVGPGQSAALLRLDQAGIGMFRREYVLFAELRGADGQTLARTTPSPTSSASSPFRRQS